MPFLREGSKGGIFVEIEVVIYWRGIGNEIGFVEVFCNETIGIEGCIGGEVGEVGWNDKVCGLGEEEELLVGYGLLLAGFMYGEGDQEDE